MKQSAEELLDWAVEAVCKKYNWSIPEKWCYPGDLIMDTGNYSFFICGDDPKDVAELRRRNVSYTKIESSVIQDFARVKAKQAVELAREQEDISTDPHKSLWVEKYNRDEIIKLLKL